MSLKSKYGDTMISNAFTKLYIFTAHYTVNVCNIYVD